MSEIETLRNLILYDRENGINYAGYDTILSWIDEIISERDQQTQALDTSSVVGRSELLKDFVNHVGFCKRQGNEKNLSEYVDDFLIL